jgi:hypothetical protein
MNKITSTLTGLALVAAASVAPAFAGGGFSPSGTGTFTATPTSFTLSGVSASYFDFTAGALYTGTASVIGGTQEVAHPTAFDSSVLSFTGTETFPAAGATNGFSFTDSGTAVLTFTGSGASQVVTVSGGKGFSNSFKFGDYPDPAAVPEASTVASFGVLLALGSLAVLRRKSVKNAA